MRTKLIKPHIYLLIILLSLTSTYAQTNHSSSLTANSNDGELIWTPDLSNIAPTTSPQKKPKSECDVIELKNGDEIIANITANEPWVVKYRKCGKLKGNPLTLSKTHIKNIKFANGKILDVEKELADRKEASKNYQEPTHTPNYYDTDQQPSYNNPNYGSNGFSRNYGYKASTDALAVLSLIASVAAFFIAGIILGILGILFGFLGLSKIERSNGTLKGKVAAYLGIALGFIALTLTIIALLILI